MVVEESANAAKLAVVANAGAGVEKPGEAEVKNSEAMNIYCDGIFDLFHAGHYRHFEKIKNMYPESDLFVGVIGDQESAAYKRRPIFSEKQRAFLVGKCRFVDKCEVV